MISGTKFELPSKPSCFSLGQMEPKNRIWGKLAIRQIVGYTDMGISMAARDNQGWSRITKHFHRGRAIDADFIGDNIKTHQTGQLSRSSQCHLEVKIRVRDH
jgi:hypothetical protein